MWFAALALAFTWPLSQHLGDSVVDQFGDNMQFVWLIGWFQKAIFQLHQWPFQAPQLNFPEGWSLARSEISPIQIVLGLPFSLLRGPVLGYNAAMLATFVLSGLAAYFWIRRMTGNAWAGLIAGTLFGFLPFHVAHFRAGHLNVAGTMWFPLFFMGGLSLLTESPRWKWAPPLAGLSFGLISLTSQYAFYMTAVVTLFAAGGYLLIWDRGKVRQRSFWTGVAAALLWSAPLVAFGELPYLSLAAGARLPDRSLADVVNGSASVSDFLLPATDHFLWGPWVADHFARDHWIEGSLYLGAVGFPLAVWGWLRGIKLPEIRRAAWLLGLLFVVGTVLTMGTHLFWNEAMVHVPVPVPLQPLLGRAETAIPLPGYVLFKIFPFYAKMRTFKRAGILALVAVCALAGVGADRLLARVPARWIPLLGMGLLGLIVIDFYPGPFEQLQRVAPRPVDQWLAAQPGDGAVAIFPFDLEQDQVQVYYSLLNGKPFLGGFFNAYPPAQYLRIRPVMNGFPDRTSLDKLQTLGVTYVLVDESRYPQVTQVESQVQAAGWSPAGRFDDIAVYVFGRGG
jgi:hypothetical protein